MNWLDKYILKSKRQEYLVNDNGDLFVGLDDEFIRSATNNDAEIETIRPIDKDEFLKRLAKTWN